MSTCMRARVCLYDARVCLYGARVCAHVCACACVCNGHHVHVYIRYLHTWHVHALGHTHMHAYLSHTHAYLPLPISPLGTWKTVTSLKTSRDCCKEGSSSHSRITRTCVKMYTSPTCACACTGTAVQSFHVHVCSLGHQTRRVCYCCAAHACGSCVLGRQTRRRQSTSWLARHRRS